MSTTAILDVIKHYQRSIDKSQHDKTRLLHCIDKLYVLPITVEHLQETGVGKTVNALRKFSGEVGVAAKSLVTKWKAMVSAADDVAEPTNNNNKSPDDDRSDIGDNDNNQRSHKSETEHHKSRKSFADQHNSNSTNDFHDSKSSSKTHRKHHKNELNSNVGRLEQKKSKSSLVEINFLAAETMDDDEEKLVIDVNKSERNDVSPDKSESEESHKDSKVSNKTSSPKKRSSHKSKKSSKRSKDNEHRHKSSSNKDRTNRTELDDKHRSSQSSSKSNSDSKKRKRSHSETKSDNSPNKNKSTKLHDEMDNSMGTSFEDALGMCNIASTSKSCTFKSPKNPKPSGSAYSSHSSQPNNLLYSRAQLEPLDPSIILDLPTISPNYKPMPLNPTVMDCVFSSACQRPRGPLTDEEAYSQGISSKTMRTKVYSGVKSGASLKVPSLFDLCIRLLQKNIDALEYTGGIPFEVLRPVLERATPEQLLQFEEYNPYIMEDTDVLWEQHIKHHYRSQKRQEYETWREMFFRCKDEREKKLNILAENIKISQIQTAAPVRKTKLAFVDSMVKPPRSIQRKQEQYGTKQKLIATPASRVSALSSIIPNAAKTGDSRLRIAAGMRDHAQVGSTGKPRKAPLMQKTLQLMKGRFKR